MLEEFASFAKGSGGVTQISGPSMQALRERIAALEDCLAELAPFAHCMRVDMQAHFSAESVSGRLHHQRFVQPAPV